MGLLLKQNLIGILELLVLVFLASSLLFQLPVLLRQTSQQQLLLTLLQSSIVVREILLLPARRYWLLRRIEGNSSLGLWFFL